jgi:hypothetical protein
MQTLWWLPNKILRHIHKKRFSVFFCRFLRICNQSVQKKLIRANTIFLLKNSIWVSKNAEFHADFKSAEKSFEKMNPKKVISKNLTEICTFSLLHMFVKLVLIVTFFGAFCCNFFNGFEISVNFAFFDIFFNFLQKNILGVILALFANFEAKCAKNSLKNQKTCCVNVS